MDPMQMTWQDAVDFVKAAGFDKDEYFHAHSQGGSLPDTVIWDEKGIRNIVVWWAPGANEGYYVHVERQLSNKMVVSYESAMLGKFWSPARAAFAADTLVRLFYGLFKDPSELIEAAKKNYEEING